MNRQGRLPFLDAIRGIAALSVFLFHAIAVSFRFSQLPWDGLLPDLNVPKSFLALYPLTYGWAGVPVFFVVSGFCIHLSYSNSREQGWQNFFKRRFFRIYPPYAAAIFIFFFLWPWGNSQLVQLITHALAVHNLDARTYFEINTSFWSIAVELQLYAIFPILIWLTRRYGWSRSIVVVGAIELTIRLASSIGTTFFHTELSPAIAASPFGFWLSWSIGAYIAQCFIDGKSSRIASMKFDLVAVIAFALPLFRPAGPFAFLAFSLLTGIAIERFLSGRWKIPEKGIFAKFWAHLSLIGILSYSFYLLHQPLLGLTRKLGSFSPLTNFVVCCVCYAPILAVSWCFYRFVEKPSIPLWKVNWIKTRKSADVIKAIAE
jgi:peptidoglycan/LPS O-acetylase OafA/YrhL